MRAVEPSAGVDLCAGDGRPRSFATFAADPVALCHAFDIDRSLDGVDPLIDANLWLAAPAARRRSDSAEPPHRRTGSDPAPAAVLRGREPVPQRSGVSEPCLNRSGRAMV